MAQDPEDEEERQNGEVDNTSHDLDLVAMYSSLTPDAQMEAEIIHGILESNGLPSLVVGAAEYPNLGFQVRVPRVRLEEARRLVEEAKATGPEDAAEGEAASEQG